MARDLPKSKMHNLIAYATKATKDTKVALRRGGDAASANQKLVWEVFAGKGHTECLEKLGEKSERFSLKEGWDFNRPKDRRAFLRRLRDESAGRGDALGVEFGPISRQED